jgi:hypothetical protein
MASNESTWRILDDKGREVGKGQAALGPVKFGDPITLGVSAWVGDKVQTLYLSCRDTNRVSTDTTRRRVGFAYQPQSWEQWKIIDPAAPTSTEIVHFGSSFALRSAFGDYLTQQTEGDGHVIQTAPSQGETEKWIVGDMVICDPKPLRHQNWISIVRTATAGENDQYSHMSAADGAANVSGLDNAADIHFDRSGLSDLSRWTVEKTNNQAVPGIKFGDTIYLGIKTYKDPAQPGALYLQYFVNQPATGGGVKVGVAPATGGREWEKWKIVNPAAPNSVAQVCYGDDFALKGLSGTGGYLSGRADPAVTSQSLGDAETFTLSDATTEVPGAVMQAPPALPWTDSAAILTQSINYGKLAAMKAAGMIPYGGGVISGVVDLLWTTTGPDIWDLIKEQVKALVKQLIEDDNFKKLDAAVRQLQTVNKNVGGRPTADTKRQALTALIAQLNGTLGETIRLTDASPQQALPYLAVVGTIHLAALREEFVNLKILYPDITAAGVTQYRQELKAMIAFYSDKVKKGREAALKWRRGLVVSEDIRRFGHSSDSYLQSNAGFRYPSNGDHEAAMNYYRDRVAEVFGSQLDAAMLPSFVWRYFDPDVDDVPTRKTATLIAGPFGKFGSAEGSDSKIFGGAFFWNKPSDPLWMIETRAGDSIYSLRLTSKSAGGATSADYPLQEAQPDSAYFLREGERFVKAYGNDGWECHLLGLGTNRGVNFESGTNKSGTVWSVTLPDDTHPYLVGLSGATGSQLCQLYLNWRYERWE